MSSSALVSFTFNGEYGLFAFTLFSILTFCCILLTEYKSFDNINHSSCMNWSFRISGDHCIFLQMYALASIFWSDLLTDDKTSFYSEIRLAISVVCSCQRIVVKMLSSCDSTILLSIVMNTYLFIYLLVITTQQKDQRPLIVSVKAQEAKSTCNTQSTKHREIEKKK